MREALHPSKRFAGFTTSALSHYTLYAIVTARSGGVPGMSQDTDRVIARIYDAVEDVDALPVILSALFERIGGEIGVLSILLKRPGPLPFASLIRLDPNLTATLNAGHV
jgi:hypothetical protein